MSWCGQGALFFGRDIQRLHCACLTRCGSHDANFGSHANFADQIFADTLHVEIDAAGRLGDKFNGTKFESLQGAGGAFASF